MFAVLMTLIFPMGTVKAHPNVPTVTPSGGNPVNLVWFGNGYAELVTAQMIDFGWVLGDQLPEHNASAMLMIQDGANTRWYIWIYEGGWDAEWAGYWSYASVGHYHWSLGWQVDNWEGAENKVHLQWEEETTP